MMTMKMMRLTSREQSTQLGSHSRRRRNLEKIHKCFIKVLSASFFIKEWVMVFSFLFRYDKTSYSSPLSSSLLSLS